MKAVESAGKKKQITFLQKVRPPYVAKKRLSQVETRYVKTVFRNGIYNKFCITMGLFWIFDKIEENRFHLFKFDLLPMHHHLCTTLKGVRNKLAFSVRIFTVGF